MKRLALRWLKFNLVGGLGIFIQLSRLKLLLVAGTNVYAATGPAVELAVLHNFAWHERFTWKDRPGGGREHLMRLLRFHPGNGAVSILGNVGLMWLFVGRLHMKHMLLANSLAIAICSILNFVLGEWFVFRS